MSDSIEVLKQKVKMAEAAREAYLQLLKDRDNAIKVYLQTHHIENPRDFAFDIHLPVPKLKELIHAVS